MTHAASTSAAAGGRWARRSTLGGRSVPRAAAAVRGASLRSLPLTRGTALSVLTDPLARLRAGPPSLEAIAESAGRASGEQPRTRRGLPRPTASPLTVQRDVDRAAARPGPAPDLHRHRHHRARRRVPVSRLPPVDRGEDPARGRARPAGAPPARAARHSGVATTNGPTRPERARPRGPDGRGRDRGGTRRRDHGRGPRSGRPAGPRPRHHPGGVRHVGRDAAPEPRRRRLVGRGPATAGRRGGGVQATAHDGIRDRASAAPGLGVRSRRPRRAAGALAGVHDAA